MSEKTSGRWVATDPGRAQGRDDGGPAFPHDPESREWITPEFLQVKPGQVSGMSLRDYFAAHAPFTLADAQQAILKLGSFLSTENDAVELLAAMRYAYADAMLKARSA